MPNHALGATFTHLRYIGYQVPTAFARNGTVVSGWDAGAAAAPPADMPITPQRSADACVRLLRLAAVADRAQVLAAELDQGLNPAVRVLTVLVAPEFYFRPPAIDNDYRQHTYPTTAAAPLWQGLDQVFTAQRFSSMIIACGTVMWNTVQDVTRPDPLYFNAMPLVRGGPAGPGPDDRLHVVEKRVPSGIDGVPVVFATQRFAGVSRRP